MIGKVPLSRLAEEKGVEIEWKSFELRPVGVEVPEKSPEFYEQAWKNSIGPMAEQFGLTMKFNLKAKHSRKAHEGAKFAIEHGKGAEYHSAVFQAQFQEDRNINDIDTLVEIAASLGLDQAAFREALESDRYEAQVLADTDLAAQIGVTAVPCFVSGNRGVMGVQSYEALERLVQGQDIYMDLE